MRKRYRNEKGERKREKQTWIEKEVRIKREWGRERERHTWIENEVQRKRERRIRERVSGEKIMMGSEK